MTHNFISIHNSLVALLQARRNSVDDIEKPQELSHEIK